MLDMIYRVYLRWPDKQTTDKTTTEDDAVAQFAFDRLKERPDLHGQDVGAALTQDGKQIAFHNFLNGIDASAAGAAS